VKLSDYNRTAEEISGARPAFLAAAISVHGINTLGPWQKRINTALADNFIRHFQVDYGFHLHRAMRPFTRGLLREVTEKIVTAYQDQRRWNLESCAIGHSFGTLSIGSALEWNPDLILDRVITFGSILPRSFPWRALVERGQVRSILNETCRLDPWVRCAPLIIAGAGASGCHGFTQEPFIEQREYGWTGHSRLGTHLHCEQTWVPFIRAHSAK
jgi:hypothetical protein